MLRLMFVRATMLLLGPVLVLAACGTDQVSISSPSQPATAVSEDCGETLMVDYFPSQKYGSATPEEALRKQAAYYGAGSRKSSPGLQRSTTEANYWPTRLGPCGGGSGSNRPA